MIANSYSPRAADSQSKAESALSELPSVSPSRQETRQSTWSLGLLVYARGLRGAAMLLVALQAMGSWAIAVLCTFIGAASLASGGVGRYLVAPVISLLKDVPRYLPAAEPECYRCGQRHCPEQDQEGVRGQLHRDPKLGQSREDRIHDDGVPGDARQNVAPGRASHYAG